MVISMAYSIFYWPTGYLLGTLRYPIGPLAISMVHYYILLVHWISLGYTTLPFWSTGYPYGTQSSLIGTLAISKVHYYLQWPTGYLYRTLPSPIGPLVIPMIHYYLLLAHWISLWYTTLSYWSTGYLFGSFYLLLAHWIYLWYTTLSYWPTGYLYGTLLSSTGPMAICIVHLYPLCYWSTGHFYDHESELLILLSVLPRV